MSRIKPYTTNQESWNTILLKKLRIPMNQREYSWEEEEISKFLDDIFKIYEENKYVEKMGSIINLNYNNGNDIYDGQQRILTIILILNVIGYLSPKLKNKINQLLTVDTEIDTLTHEQEQIKEKCNVNIIPKIYCINPFDMEGLVNIFNNKIKSWVEYLSNIQDFDLLDEDEDYICNVCKIKTSKKADFKKHITHKHGYIKPHTNTKLHNAFIEIYNYFAIKKYDEAELINLYKFILHDIDVQYYDCNDPEYVSRIFDWENNRGKAVETLDIIKNPILVKIPDDKKVEIYEKWESLKHKHNNIYKKNFGQKIFDVAIQLYNNEIKRTINHEELFKSIIDSKDYSTISSESYIVKPQWTIPEDSTKIHGITQARAEAEGIPLSVIIEKFSSIDHDIMIAHNMNFDYNVLVNAILWDLNIKVLPEFKPRFCTMELMKNIVQIPYANGRGFKPPKLTELYTYVVKKPFDSGNTHNAEYDTWLLAEIVKSSSYLQKVMGLTAVPDSNSNASKKARITLIL